MISMKLLLCAVAAHALQGPQLRTRTSLKATRTESILQHLEGEGAGGLRGKVAMVYQDFVNYPSLRVGENIAAPLRARRVARSEIARRVEAAAARVAARREAADHAPGPQADLDREAVGGASAPPSMLSASIRRLRSLLPRPRPSICGSAARMA